LVARNNFSNLYFVCWRTSTVKLVTSKTTKFTNTHHFHNPWENNPKTGQNKTKKWGPIRTWNWNFDLLTYNWLHSGSADPKQDMRTSEFLG
jgi:hypothetical protein